ncbi:hypothetical protein L6164_036179 [Bauhinia variegata]|uniref:Uncharacterized protein n=1 Tax=Bauhinia variegata TaxID=167791 RepID=A0ACB9KG73_BAUVA|nr:hypothetical protein L6164_036179 [Bauhinia variegata]
MVEFEYQELVKATDNFNPTRLIGKGSHGLVYKGILIKDNNNLVAVKKPSRALQSQNDNSKLQNEIRVLSSLRQNPHVINLLGTSHDSSNNELLVMEFMPNASLHDWLHKTTPPPWPKRVQIAMQVARAVQFLHEGKPLVIHRDIKSANVLFDSDWNSKLADFGLAVIRVDSGSRPVSQPAGTIGYLDPCYTSPGKLSTKNDIFSFGVLVLEIISGRKAIDVQKTPASIIDWAIPLIQEQVFNEICDARIPLPAYMGSTIRHFLGVTARCVLPNENDRPSIGEVIRTMENCFVQRVRFPNWAMIFKSMVSLRKRRKMSTQSQSQSLTKCAVEDDGDDARNMSSRKVLLREVLADG